LNEANLSNLPNSAGAVASTNINALIEEDDANNADLKDEISEFSGFSSSIHSGKDSKDKSFIMRNGCCKECMKAFSKSGKSCLCQVPRLQRRATLPSNGCKFCGCKGCNPIDIRRDKRQELKKKLKKEGKYNNKRQRLIDSDDEELALFTEADRWIKTKKDFMTYLGSLLSVDPSLLGFGFPLRSPSYILGSHHKWVTENEYKAQKGGYEPHI